MAVQRMAFQRVIRKLFINGQLSNEALVIYRAYDWNCSYIFQVALSGK
jgi:hypothetical protein